MTNCSGIDLARYAADPDWWEQLETQMRAVQATLEEINDESLREAFEAFETVVGETHSRIKRMDLIDVCC